jgi:hypothetical protein
MLNLLFRDVLERKKLTAYQAAKRLSGSTKAAHKRMMKYLGYQPMSKSLMQLENDLKVLGFRLDIKEAEDD